jgi:hypothetical protein
MKPPGKTHWKPTETNQYTPGELHTEATESPATTNVRAIKLGKAWVQGGTSNKINQNKATRKYNNNKQMNTK